jgi:hypothetical protein
MSESAPEPEYPKDSPVRFVAGSPEDPRHGYGLCLSCPGKVVHYQELTRAWIYDDGSFHTGHKIQLLPDMERKPLELHEMLAGHDRISPEVKALATAPDLLFKIKIDLDRFIVGEDENKLHLFLICLSCATSRPLGAIITGEASSGKPTLLHGVTQYFSNVDYFTRITPASIDRLPKALTGRILVVEELRGAEAAQSSIYHVLARLRAPTPNPASARE